MAVDEVQSVLGRRLVLEKYTQKNGAFCIITAADSLDVLSLDFDDQSKLRSYSVDRF